MFSLYNFSKCGVDLLKENQIIPFQFSLKANNNSHYYTDTIYTPSPECLDQKDTPQIS